MKVVLQDKDSGGTKVLVSDSKCCPFCTLVPDGRIRCQLTLAGPGPNDGTCPCDDTLPDDCPLLKGPVLVKKVR